MERHLAIVKAAKAAGPVAALVMGRSRLTHNQILFSWVLGNHFASLVRKSGNAVLLTQTLAFHCTQEWEP